MNAPQRKPSCANASSSAAVRRRSSVACAVLICAVLTVPATPPVGVPSGMRTSRLRGGGSAGVGDVGFAAVDDVAGVVGDVVVGRPAVVLVPGGVSDSGTRWEVP